MIAKNVVDGIGLSKVKKQEQFHTLSKDLHQIKVCFGHKHENYLNR
ncbi:hypothetical protein RintRC_7532 [Richelia intracellularis]|nr:hypothetical protein RintRC_7532 [Richelia intracellularis]